MNKKSVKIVAVVLMLAGMVLYVMTLDLSEEPVVEEIEENPAAVPTSTDE